MLLFTPRWIVRNPAEPNTEYNDPTFDLALQHMNDVIASALIKGKAVTIKLLEVTGAGEVERAGAYTLAKSLS